MCKIKAAVVWSYSFHFIPPKFLEGVSRNPWAARAKVHENKMAV